MKVRKWITFALAAGMLLTATAGCGEKKETADGKVEVSIGLWPDETQPELLERYTKMREDFMEKNPDILITPDTYAIDSKTFVLKASAGQLPNMFKTWFTEIKPNIKAGYVADITEPMKAHGLDQAINPELMKLVTGEDGKIYGVPTDAYAQGLFINKKLFREAGLVNEDGSVKIPSTYQELAEFAQTIKEKTGKPGFCISTTNNCGGWHFVNIAWAFGTEFVKQNDDGKWEAVFDTQEARDALQYVKDLKWKYDVFPEDKVVDLPDMRKFFGTYQAGMVISDPPCSEMAQKYGLDPADLCVARMPEGPAGRFSQMGGSLWMFSKNTTAEQVDACLKWLEYTGFSPKLSEEQEQVLRDSYQQTINDHGIVLDKNAFDLWSEKDAVEKDIEIRADYANIDHADYEDYYSFEGVTINPEPYAAQQLYSVLDGCIQEVLTNENADVAQIIKKACEDFQVNHLDKM